MVRDTNSSITLIHHNISKGVLIVGYTLLNTLIQVTFSFNTPSLSHTSDMTTNMTNAHSKGIVGTLAHIHSLSSLSYDNLTIDGKIHHLHITNS